MTIKQSFRNFFRPQIASKALSIEIKAQRESISTLKNEYLALTEWHHTYVSALSTLTESMGALVWTKDRDNNYLLANELHCKNFFGFDGTKECLEYIVGKTDTELIVDIYRDHGVENTFGEICNMSDDYIRGKDKPVHFLEAGVVDGTEVLLYVIKTPQYDSTGYFTGSVGVGWDITPQADFLIQQLNKWIYEDNAVSLYHAPSVFCYAVTPDTKQCKVFRHFCPTPGPDNECDDDCTACKQGD